MSVSGILSNFFDPSSLNVQTKKQPIQQEFQQLGQDLQSGNLSAAQADFAALQSSSPQTSSTSSPQNNNPIAQAFKQLSQDLQSGNVSAAQSDFSTIQQDFQNQAAQTHPHHHHRGGEQQSGAISQLVTQLGQSLRAGNLAAAQQAYGALQQDFLQSSQQNTSASSQALSQPSPMSLSVIA